MGAPAGSVREVVLVVIELLLAPCTRLEVLRAGHGRRARARVAARVCETNIEHEIRRTIPAPKISGHSCPPRSTFRARPRPRPSHGVDARALGARAVAESALVALSPSGVARPACDSRDACRAPRAPRSGGWKSAPARRGRPRATRAPASIVAPRAFHARRATMTPPVGPPPRPPRGAVPPPRPRSSTPCPPRAPRCPDRAHMLALRRLDDAIGPRARPHPPELASASNPGKARAETWVYASPTARRVRLTYVDAGEESRS